MTKMTEGEVRWISTGRGMGSRRGAEGEKAAGGARGERIEVAPRGCGARRGSEHRGVAGGVEDQRAARLVRHVRNRTSLVGVASFPLSAPFMEQTCGEKASRGRTGRMCLLFFPRIKTTRSVFQRVTPVL